MTAGERWLVGDDTVNPEIEQSLHVLGGVDRPRINLLSAAVRPPARPP